MRSGSAAAVRRCFLGGGATHSRPRCVHLSHGLARSHLILLSAQGTQDRRRTRELLRRELAVEGNLGAEGTHTPLQVFRCRERRSVRVKSEPHSFWKDEGVSRQVTDKECSRTSHL
jgi:hypothetical protein